MTSGVAPGHDAAEDALARDYELLRGDVVAALRSKLGAQRVHADEGDLDEFYNQAWHALYTQLAKGAEVESRAGFLVTVGYRRAIDELRRMHPDRRGDDVDVTAIGADVDLASRLDDATRMRHLMEGMRERLDAREQRAAALCLIHGYTRPEAATALGLSGRRMEKVMDGVTRKLARLTGDIADDWCRNRESLIAAYALGLLEAGGERHAAAIEHLRECSACRRSVNQRRGLAAVLPPIGLPLVLTGALAKAGAGAGAAGAGAGVLHRLARLRPHGGGGGVGSHAIAATSAGGLAVVGLVAIGVSGGPSGGGSHGQATSTPAAALPDVATISAHTHTVPQRHRPHRAARRHHPRRTATPAPAAAATPQAATPAPDPTPAASAPATPAPAPTRSPAQVAPSKPTVVTDAAQEFGPEH